MRVTEASNPVLYRQLFDARRAAIIDAAVLVHDTEAWISQQEATCSDEKVALELAKSEAVSSAIKPIIDARELALNASHEELQTRLAAFKLVLADFKQRIDVLNTRSTHNSANLVDLIRRSASDKTIYFGSSYLSAAYTAARCPKQQVDKLYDPNSNVMKMEIAARGTERGIARLNMLPLFAIGLVGYVLGIVICPWFLLLIPVAILIGVTSALIMKNRDHIETKTPIFSDAELQAIYTDGEAGVNVQPSVIESNPVKAGTGSSAFFANTAPKINEIESGIEMTPRVASLAFSG